MEREGYKEFTKLVSKTVELSFLALLNVKGVKEDRVNQVLREIFNITQKTYYKKCYSTNVSKFLI